MNSHSHRQNQVLVILTIATAALGFGLIETDFRIPAGILSDPGLGPFLARLKLGFGMAAIIFYAGVLGAVRTILIQDDDVTGRQVADGPLARLYWELVYVVLIFIVGVFEQPDPNQ